MIFAFSLVNAFDRPLRMLAVHTDNIKFEMMPTYEKLAKQLEESCNTYNSLDVN